MPLKLYKRDGEVWHYTGTVAGRRLRGSTKTTQKREAERFANDVESRELQGRRDPGAILTFAQAAIKYREAKGDKKYLERVEDYWRDTPVKDITRGAMKRAALEILPQGAGSYRNRAVIVPTQAVINFAASIDLCPPLRALRFPEQFATKEPATLEWVLAFMAHASPHLGALACFMFGTGARISEAISVRWGDIDLQKGTARIVMGKVGGVERIAHLQPALVAALANIPRDRDPEDRPFPYASYRACSDPWEVAIKRAGIKRLTPHCCRHGFATSMLHAGYDPKTVAEAGGWADVSQLFKTYGHARNDKTVTNALFDTPQAQEHFSSAQVSGNKRKSG